MSVERREETSARTHGSKEAERRETTVLTRKNVNKRNLFRYLLYGWLPIPESIIPPKRPYYLWSKLDITPYDPSSDYNGKLLDQIRRAVQVTLKGWEPIDRVGVWLSGGIDSSVLLYFTTELVGPEKVRAYCLTFGERDESEYAERIADWCGVKLVKKEMTPEDSIRLTREAVLLSRAPVDSTVVLFISKLCAQDGTSKVLSALGLDELLGGYPQHVQASDRNFHRVETELIWRCQSYYVWLQLSQSKGYVEVRFPFLEPNLIAFCRGLPRIHKCSGQETKVRLREELRKKSLIPRENIEVGRVAGTKGGFIPILRDWFDRGYGEWCRENIPPRGLNSLERLLVNFVLRAGKSEEGRLQRMLRVAALNTFFDLLDEGGFTVEGGEA
ncbi:MAG: asparagine synthase C-terminal domain-containing protein [Desulfurococcaceae archaeon]